MKANVDDYFCSSTESYGFKVLSFLFLSYLIIIQFDNSFIEHLKVLLHNPNDLPNVAYLGMAIPSNYESRLAVTPALSIGAPSIRKLGVDVRKCIFESENFLTYFR